MSEQKSKSRDDLEVLNVAPSTRAIWRIRRLTARASGRPRLAVRRVEAAAAKLATEASSEIILDNENEIRGKRRQGRSSEVVLDTEASAKRPRQRSRTPPRAAGAGEDRKTVRAQTAAAAEDGRTARLEAHRLAQQKANCEAQLAAALSQLGAEKRKSEGQEALLAAERRRNQALQEKVDSQAWQYEGLLREKARLWQRVQELQRESQNRVSRAQAPVAPAPIVNQEALVKQIADMECRPLRGKGSKVAGALKKKLLVKWHPDKQPSADHGVLATSVMQEMQNRPEWRT